MFQSFWPKVAEAIDSDEWTEEQKELSRAGRGVSYAVASDSLRGVRPDVRLIRGGELTDAVRKMKAEDGRDILVTGSRTLWNHLLARGLVDEIHLLVGGRLLGEGIPAFSGEYRGALKLVEALTFDSSDSVLLKYGAPNEA